jgi:UDP-glucuronate decarboxylase
MIQHNSASPLYREAWGWLSADMQRVYDTLGEKVDAFSGKRVLVTGAGGFLGFNFLHFFSFVNSMAAGKPPVTVCAVDNFLRGKSRWITELVKVDPNLELMEFDITKPWPGGSAAYDFIIHGASVASPIYYRKYPLETLDANIIGLRSMLDMSRQWKCDSMLFFSSSEIYGDPPPHEIPTKESFRGLVSCIGPRACYDESKRLGETLCYLYAEQYGVPVKIVRPFNNYGPGLRLTDGRVLTDFCRNLLEGTDIVLYSDGSPTRTFCYASDALTGYLLTLLSAYNGEPFNIGSDIGEISMRGMGEVLLKVAKSSGKIIQKTSHEKHYLTDNPNRRCPNLEKARTLLGYAPAVPLEDGLARTLEWYTKFLALEELA